MYRVLCKIGPLEIYTYGLMVVVAFIISLIITNKMWKAKSYSSDQLLDLCAFILVGGIIGARLLYVILFLDEYIKEPLQIINLRRGGLSWHGALLGGVLIGLWYTKRKKLPFGDIADLVSPGIILGLAIGRIGCFLNGCCLGKETQLPWGVVFHQTIYSGPRHPTQIYEMLLDLGIFFILYRLLPQKRFNGQVFLLLLILYSAARFYVEFYREGTIFWGLFTAAQWVSILIIAVAGIIYYYLDKAFKK